MLPESAPASVDIKGRPEDRRALAMAFRDQRRWSGRLTLLIACAGFALVVILGRGLFMRYWQMPVEYAATLAAFIGLVVFITTLDLSSRNRVQKTSDPRGSFLKGYRLTLGEDGVQVESENFQALHRWSGILKLQETATHMFLYTDGAQAIIVPKRSFTSPEQAASFASTIRARMAPA